ncbi:MAG TPA: DUF4340 domain-containing protein [Kofleriaceae bacterium]|nr:DUF4340 domain-containing protein [Kofleriaceae bacterium]
MSSRGTLIALSVIAAALSAWVVLGAPADHRISRSTRLVPEQSNATLVRLEARSADGAHVVLEREAGSGAYRVVEPVRAPADPSAVDDLLRTLEILSYRREVDDAGQVSGLSAPRATLTLTYDTRGTVELRLGAHVDTTEQDFIARSDRSGVYLIDGHAGRVLERVARRPDTLRARRVLRTRNRDVTGVEIHAGGASLILGGRPLAVHLDDTAGAVRADPDAIEALLGRIDDLRLTRFIDQPLGAPPEDAVSIKLVGEHPAELIEHGPCPGSEGERLVATPVGAGCVRALELAAITFAVSLGPQLVDRHLVALDQGKPVSITLTTAAGEPLVMRATGAGWAVASGDDGDLDADAVLEWARELDELPADALVPAPTSPPAARVIIELAGGRTDTIVLYRAGTGLLVGRAGEAIAFPVDATAATVISPPRLRFRPRALWSLDPTTLRAAERRAGTATARLERGQLLEDWSSPNGSVDPAAAGALAEAAARARAVAWVAPAPRPAHGLGTQAEVLTLRFEPLSGPPVTHRLRLGAEVNGSCYAQVDDDPAVAILPAPTCSALRARWTE